MRDGHVALKHRLFVAEMGAQALRVDGMSEGTAAQPAYYQPQRFV